MTDKRRHRGAHPADKKLFAPEQIASLQAATADLSWLLSRDYALPSSLKLTGDRYQLTQRQRLAVMRSAAGDGDCSRRSKHNVRVENLAGKAIDIDGYNVLTTVESALAGGVLLRGRDKCLRDIAGVHGSFRKVEETFPALEYINNFLQTCAVRQWRWLLDQPVSNSGRLAFIIRQQIAANHLPATVEVVINPDAILKTTPHIAASSDSEILNHCKRWCDLAGIVIDSFVKHTWLIDLSSPAQTS
ncbi:MAG: DUF434 domain-containing protein [Sedimentisphaerales bacterium]|nr:DUF434 domain-containing protein [Sedimentisphaerales bacterium]